MKKTILVFFVCLYTSSIFAVEMTASSLSDNILTYLKLKEVYYYTTLEDAVECLGLPQSIKIETFENDTGGKDIYYSFYYNGYFIMFISFLNKYYLNAIQIDILENENFRSLLPYETIEQYKDSNTFGHIIYVDDNKNNLMYEINENWNYLTLSFENGNIKKITFGFILE